MSHRSFAGYQYHLKLHSDTINIMKIIALLRQIMIQSLRETINCRAVLGLTAVSIRFKKNINIKIARNITKNNFTFLKGYLNSDQYNEIYHSPKKAPKQQKSKQRSHKNTKIHSFFNLNLTYARNNSTLYTVSAQSPPAQVALRLVHALNRPSAEHRTRTCLRPAKNNSKQ